MWEQFATIIHEYIHTLEHGDHESYRSGMQEQRGGLTLREGMCDYFTKMVWDTVNFTPTLRRSVEGRYHDPAINHPIPPPTFYDSAAEAERAVGIVGVRNAMAAFFLGEVSLIGGPLNAVSRRDYKRVFARDCMHSPPQSNGRFDNSPQEVDHDKQPLRTCTDANRH